jgi:uroporphyrinogen decarboxylase
LMRRLSSMVVSYLRAQVDAGAEVVQLFDSWVGGLSPVDYRTFVQPHVRRIFDAIPDVPTIHFGTGTGGLLEDLVAAGGDVIGLDHRVSLSHAWERVGFDRGVQGNLDASRLLAGWEATETGARTVLEAAGGRRGHVFNLGHGVLPDTDTDLLRRLVDFVHEATSARTSTASATA